MAWRRSSCLAEETCAPARRSDVRRARRVVRGGAAQNAPAALMVAILTVMSPLLVLAMNLEEGTATLRGEAATVKR